MIQEKDVQSRCGTGEDRVRILPAEGSGRFPPSSRLSPYRYDNNELPPRPMFLWRETGPIEWYANKATPTCTPTCAAPASRAASSVSLPREQQDLHGRHRMIARQKWFNARSGASGSRITHVAVFMGIQNPPHLACCTL